MDLLGFLYSMEQPTQKGCVYFFKHKGLGHVKIGHSTKERPTEAFNKFLEYSPNGGQILLCVDSYKPQQLHDELITLFSDKHTCNNWFNITYKDINKELLKLVKKTDINKGNKNIDELDLIDIFDFLDGINFIEYKTVSFVKSLYNLKKNKDKAMIKTTHVMKLVLKEYFKHTRASYIFKVVNNELSVATKRH